MRVVIEECVRLASMKDTFDIRSLLIDCVEHLQSFSGCGVFVSLVHTSCFLSATVRNFENKSFHAAKVQTTKFKKWESLVFNLKGGMHFKAPRQSCFNSAEEGQNLLALCSSCSILRATG